MVPAEDLPVAEARREAVVINGTIGIMTDVFLAGPYDFEGALDLLGNAHRLLDAVNLEPPAEAATQIMIAKNDLVERQAGKLGGGRLAAGLYLDANPDLAGIGFHMHCAVHRLHRSVGEEGKLITRIHPLAHAQRLVDVTGRFCRRARPLACGRGSLPYLARAYCGIRPFVPLYVESGEALLSRPCVIGDNAHKIVEHDDLAHAGNHPRTVVIDVGHFATKHRASGERGELHTRGHGVDSADS